VKVENLQKRPARTLDTIFFAVSFYLVVLAYVIPLSTDYGNAAIYWLALFSSLSIVCYLFARISCRGWLAWKNTSLDMLIILYLIWIVISFLANSLVNILTGNAEHLIAQFQSLAIFVLIFVHYILGRFSNSFGFPFSKFNMYVAGLYFLACSSVLLYVLFTGDLYLARGDLGQRYPILVVFWAWYFGGFWLVTGNRKYFVVFLLGSVVCLLSLTRAAYMQWVVSAVALFIAAGFRPMFKGAVIVLIASGMTVLVADQYYDSAISTVVDRASEFLDLANVVAIDSSASFRLHVWEGVVSHLLENPVALVFGYGQLGPSYLPIDFIGDFETVRGISAHSQYLDTLVRAGIPGLIIELGISLVAIFTLFRRNTPTQIKIIAACLVGYLVFGLFHESIRWPVFGIIFWFFVGVIAQHLENRNPSYRGRSVRVPNLPSSGAALRPRAGDTAVPSSGSPS
jgi:O-antigen ligase